MFPDPVLSRDPSVQATILTPVTLSGIGLHRGGMVTMELLPAPADSGITFVRTDLSARPRLTPGPGNISGNNRGTDVSEGGVTVHTIEHFLAACWGMGIDNLEVHLDADEPPAGDGSALLFVEKLAQAGRSEQDRPRRAMYITRQVTVEDGPGKLVAGPDDGFRVSYTLEYENPVIGTQKTSARMDRPTFREGFASARTFCLLSEIEMLKARGLARGGSLENALVVDSEKVLNGPLRFADEFARHKVLDLVGDLATLGVEIRGQFSGTRSGHKLNVGLVKKLVREGAMEIVDAIKTTYSFEEIQTVLPHRYPFLLIDRITDLVPGKSARGIKSVTGNERFFQGHFPGKPLMPGVLILEALAQVAGMCILVIPENRGKVPYFTGLDDVHFRRPVVPGDQLILEVEVQRIRQNMGWMAGRALVEGNVAAQGILKFTVR